MNHKVQITLRLFFIAISIFILIFFVVFFILESTKNKRDIEIKSRYMFYACGDCYPNFRIEEVIGSNMQSNNIIGQDIDLEFKDTKLQHSFESSTKKCMFCCRFQFKGDLNYSILKRHYVLNVKKYYVTINKSCCDTYLYEIHNN